MKGHKINNEIKVIRESNIDNMINTVSVVRAINQIRNQVAHHLSDIHLPKNIPFNMLSNEYLSKYISRTTNDNNSIYNIDVKEIENWINQLDDNFKWIITSMIYIDELLNLIT